MSPKRACSAVLFGPQLINLKAEDLNNIRNALHSISRLENVYEAAIHLDEFGERLHARDHELRAVHVQEVASMISNWVKNNDSLILQELEDHSNAIAGTITVINHVLLFMQHVYDTVFQHHVSAHSQSVFQGLCLGKLTATAVQMSSNDQSLAELAVVAIQLAFCIGMYVDLDRRNAGKENEARSIAVGLSGGSVDLEKLQQTIDKFDSAYFSIIQRSKVTITVSARQAVSILDQLKSMGYHAKSLNLRGRFHCSEVSWSVERILQHATHFHWDQLMPRNTIRTVLQSILVCPQDYLAELQQIRSISKSDAIPLLFFIADHGASNKMAEAMGFKVHSHDDLKTCYNTIFAEKQNLGLIEHGNMASARKSESLLWPESAIAVTGMACRFAGTDSPEDLWHILETGKVMCQDLPLDRFPDARFDRREFPKAFKANALEDVDTFDHKFFGISSREATSMDPQQRLALQVAYQALESAGYFHREADASKDIGCYIGACTNEYHENVATHAPSAFSLTGSIRPFIAGKMSHHFGWTGPAIMVDTACAASGTAIHQACRAVASGECNEAIAGGVNVFVSPDTFQNLAAGHFISRTGASKSFDASADGYCRGEGVAFVMLKKLDAAVKDGDAIRGVIASTAVGQNANKTSITVPHGPSQMALYRKALKAGRVDAETVSYVEAHGTGTAVGDPIEVESIRRVFGNSSTVDPRKTYMGSLKSNIGHTEATSGVSGLIKTLLMMEKGIIPRQALFQDLNPAINPLESDGIEIPAQNLSWNSSFRAACVNNYGASGANAVMVVTQPPNRLSRSQDAPALTFRMRKYPIAISAFSGSSLKTYCRILLKFVDDSMKSSKVSLADIAYNLYRRWNPSLPYHICTTVSSFIDLKQLCTDAIEKAIKSSQLSPKSVILFFGGQTGDTATIPQILYESSAIYRKYVLECDEILKVLGFESILPEALEVVPRDNLVRSHAILFTEQYASAMAWLNCGLKPTRLIGHSFGYLTALCVGGVLSLSDGLRLVTSRAQVIERCWGRDRGGMIAVEAPIKTLSTLLADAHLEIEIACHNGPRSFVVAGTTRSCDAFAGILAATEGQIRWKRLGVTHAFHTALTEPLMEPLRTSAEQLTFRTAKIPIESCTQDGFWEEVTPSHIVSHTGDAVYFSKAVNRISEMFGPCTWLEAGSGTGINLLKKALDNNAPVHTFHSISKPEVALDSLAKATSELWSVGIDVQFWPFHPSQRHEYAMLNVPPYQFDKFRHWLEWRDLGSVVKVPQSAAKESSLLRLFRQNLKESAFHIDTQCDEWRSLCARTSFAGILICPLSSLLSLAVKAVDAAKKGQWTDVLPFEISNLNVARSVTCNHTSGLDLTITHTNQPRSWVFRMTDSTHEYISGMISVFDEGHAHLRTLEAFQSLLATKYIKSLGNDPDADSVRGKAVYKSLAPWVNIPKSQQRIKEVSMKDKEAISHIDLSDAVRFEALDSFVDVALLCLNCFQDRENDEVYVSAGIGSVTFRPMAASLSGPESCYVAYLKFKHLESTDPVCDIFVFASKDEQLFATALDVTFKLTKITVLQQSSADHHDIIPTISSEPTAANTTREGKPQTQEIMEAQQIVQTQPPRTLPVQLTSSPTTQKKNIDQTLFALLARVTDIDLDSLHGSFLIADLGIDSLMAIEVSEEITKCFSIDINFSDFMLQENLASLSRFITQRSTQPDLLANASYGATTSDVDYSSELNTPQSVTGSSAFGDGVSRKDERLSAETEPSLNGPPAPKTAHKALQSFKAVRNDYALIFAQAIDNSGTWSDVQPYQTSLIAAYITEAFAKLGCDLRSTRPGEKFQPPHLPTKARLLHQLLLALQDGDIITQAEDSWLRTNKPIPTAWSSELYQDILSLFPKWSPDHKLLHIAGSNLHGYLNGTIDPLKLLFGTPEKRQIMADQYTLSPIQSSVSRHLARFLTHYLGTSTPESIMKSDRKTKEPIRILELGGGTCGTSVYVLSALAQLDLDISYTFSDISPSFLTAAKSKLPTHPLIAITYRTLDISLSPPSELQAAFDIILATNVLHATPDVKTSAAHVRRMLAPGGVFAMVEYTRRLAWLDVVFGMLEGWWGMRDGRAYVLLGIEGWREVLAGVGFEGVEWMEGEGGLGVVLGW